MTPRYPVLLDLEGQPCLVVGGGAVAQRKVRSLLEVGAEVTVIAPAATPMLAGAAQDGALCWHERSVVDADVAGSPAGPAPWRFVVAATDDSTVNAAMVEACSAAGIWANDASSPTGGPAALPAVHRAGPVTIAVSTGGVHPAAAGWLRDLVAEGIGPEHLLALDLVAEVRAGSADGARPDWRVVVDSGMLDLIRKGRVAEAKERLQACLSSSSD